MDSAITLATKSSTTSQEEPDKLRYFLYSIKFTDSENEFKIYSLELLQVSFWPESFRSIKNSILIILNDLPLLAMIPTSAFKFI